MVVDVANEDPVPNLLQLLSNVVALAEPAFGLGPGRSEYPAEILGKLLDCVV